MFDGENKTENEHEKAKDIIRPTSAKFSRYFKAIIRCKI